MCSFCSVICCLIVHLLTRVLTHTIHLLTRLTFHCSRDGCSCIGITYQEVFHSLTHALGLCTCSPMHTVTSGMFTGIGGGAGPNRSDANIGTTVGEIYDPTQPIGQHWSTVADSQIWRLYHSVAFIPDIQCRGKRAISLCVHDTLSTHVGLCVTYAKVGWASSVYSHCLQVVLLLHVLLTCVVCRDRQNWCALPA